jgi:methionyl aminopeptidase
MIIIKDKGSIRKMHTAGQFLADLLADVAALVVPGTSTGEIDAWIEKGIQAKGLVSQMKGYAGYQYASCISLNDEVVHGVPAKSRLLQEGDLVKVDVCASWKGYCADMARPFIVGAAVYQPVVQFIEAAWRGLNSGIEKAQVGNRLFDISAAVQKEVEASGYGVVRDFVGHGIGKSMHEDPEVPNYGTAGRGPVLRSGMAFALEPMITMGNYEVFVDPTDKWTVRTVDKSLAMHVEDTIVILESGPCILTRHNDIRIV